VTPLCWVARSAFSCVHYSKVLPLSCFPDCSALSLRRHCKFLTPRLCWPQYRPTLHFAPAPDHQYSDGAAALLSTNLLAGLPRATSRGSICALLRAHRWRQVVLGSTTNCCEPAQAYFRAKPPVTQQRGHWAFMAACTLVHVVRCSDLALPLSATPAQPDARCTDDACMPAVMECAPHVVRCSDLALPLGSTPVQHDACHTDEACMSVVMDSAPQSPLSAF
jgi:hypothetical protein